MTPAIIRALARVHSCATIPILATVLVAGRTLTTTDTYTTLRVTLPPDAAPLPPALLDIAWFGRLAKLAGKKHAIRLTPDGATVGGTAYRAPRLGHDVGTVADFPAYAPAARATFAALEPADFRRAGAVVVALDSASTDRARPGLYAVHLAPIVSGTDGHRLARRTPVAADTMEGLDVLLERPAVQLVIAMVAAAPPVTMWARADDRLVTVAATCADGSAWEVTSRIVQTAHPPYEEIAPADPGTPVVVPGDFARDAAKLYGRHGGAYVAIWADGSCAARAIGTGERATSAGTMQESRAPDGLLPADPPLAIVNASYLADALDSTTGDVTIHVAPNDGPMTVLGHLVMPMSLEKIALPACLDRRPATVPLAA